MAKIIMRVTGADGQIDLLSDRVVIHRHGVWNMVKYGFNARREIPLMAISEVSFRGASILTFGEIDFVRSGRSKDERKKSSDSTVKFNRKNQPRFEMFKEKVFELMNQYSQKTR